MIKTDLANQKKPTSFINNVPINSNAQGGNK